MQLCFADQPSEQLLAKVTAAIYDLGVYGADIAVSSYGANPIVGRYEVDGENYYLNIAGQEMFGADNTKYEVYRDRQEVIIDRLLPREAGNILDNPTRAFDFVESGFESSISLNSGTTQTVMLTPNSDSGLDVEHVELVVDSEKLLPTQISYSMDGEVITIKITNLKTMKRAIKIYDESNYVDFEIIDFR